MDYIQEELRRQREALARLLLGGSFSGGRQEEEMGGSALPGEALREAEASFPAEGFFAAENLLPEAGGVPGGTGVLPGRALSRTGGFFPETVWPGRRAGYESGGGGRPLPSAGEPPGALTAAYQEGKGPSPSAERAAEAEAAERTAEAIWAFWAETGGRRIPGGETAESAASSRQAASGGRYLLPAVSGALPEDGQARFWTVTELAVPAPGTGTEARDLSRAFQRDARRYDGGFTLY